MKPTLYIPVNSTGYGIHAMNMTRSAVEKDLVNLVPYWNNIYVPDDFGEEYLKKAKYGIENRTQLQKTPLSFIFCHSHLLTSPSRFNIGYTTFELDVLREDEIQTIQQLSLIGTASKWGQKVFQSHLPHIQNYVIPGGVDTQRFSRTLPPENNKPRFISVGKFEKRKGHLSILKAIRDFEEEIVVDLFWANFFVDTKEIAKIIMSNGFMIAVSKPDLLVFISKNKKVTLNFYPWQQLIDNLLDKLSIADYGLYPSAAEGWNLPLCVPEGKLILEKNGFKQIEQVQKGDYVIGHNKKLKKVLHTFKRSYNDKLIQISLYNDHEKLELTPEHPAFVIKRGKFITKQKRFKLINDIEPTWIKAKDIKKGDLVIRTKPEQIFYEDKIIDLLEVDNTLEYDTDYVWYKMGFNPEGKIKKYNRFIKLYDLTYLLAWYIAEGHSEKSALYFSLNANSEVNIAENILDNISTLFDTYGNFYINENKLNVKISSKILSKLFTYLCGNGALNKYIPKEILFGPEKYQEILLENLVKGDGSIIQNRFLYGTSSEILSRQIVLLVEQLGMKPAIQVYKEPTKGSFYTENPHYVISWSKNSNLNHSHSNKTWHHNYGTAILVKKVNQIDYSGYVYNIEVEEDNSYLLSNATVHNCEAMSMGIPCITTDNTAHSEYIIPNKNALIVECKKEPAIDGKFFKNASRAWDMPTSESIKQKMHQIMNMNTTKISEEARKTALKYDWKNIHIQFEALIENAKESLL